MGYDLHHTRVRADPRCGGLSCPIGHHPSNPAYIGGAGESSGNTETSSGCVADRRATSCALSSIAAAAAEERAVEGRVEPGIGITHGPSASSHASATCWGEISRCAATSAKAAYREPRSPAWEAPPSGDHGRKAIPRSMQRARTSASARYRAEYSFCTAAMPPSSGPPTSSRARSSIARVTFDRPMVRAIPSAFTAARPPTCSAKGTAGSWRWRKYRSITSTPRRCTEARAAAPRASGVPERPHRSPSGPGARVIPPLVAITIRARSASDPAQERTASPTSTSLCPKCSPSGA